MSSDGNAASGDNPYAAPSHAFGQDVQAGEVPQASLEATKRLLLQIRPWTMFLALFGVIVGTLFVALGILATIMVAWGESLSAAAVTMVFYVFTGGAVLAAAVQLLRYDRRIKTFANGGGIDELNAAMAAQRAFWRVLGLSLAGIIISFLVLIFWSTFAGLVGIGWGSPA